MNLARLALCQPGTSLFERTATMKFTALSTFVIFNGEMNVFNAGDEGDLPEEQIIGYIEGGKAVAIADVSDDSQLADDAAALAEMTGAEPASEPDGAVSDDAAPAAATDAPPPAAKAKK
jgi:hypothetical protein